MAEIKRLALHSVELRNPSVEWSFDPAFHLYVVIAAPHRDPVHIGKINRPYYWRLEAAKASLFAIEVDCFAGSVVGVSVPLYRLPLHPISRRLSRQVTETGGVPVFPVSLWPGSVSEEVRKQSNRDDFINQTAPIRVEMSGAELRLCLFEDEIGGLVRIGDRLDFEFNHANELCAVTLHSVQEAILAQIRKHLKPEGSSG